MESWNEENQERKCYVSRREIYTKNIHGIIKAKIYESCYSEAKEHGALRRDILISTFGYITSWRSIII